MPEEVTLYVVPGCPLCADVRHWMHDNAIHFLERDVANDYAALRSMARLTHQRLVPVVQANGQALVRPTHAELAKLLK